MAERVPAARTKRKLAAGGIDEANASAGEDFADGGEGRASEDGRNARGEARGNSEEEAIVLAAVEGELEWIQAEAG